TNHDELERIESEVWTRMDGIDGMRGCSARSLGFSCFLLLAPEKGTTEYAENTEGTADVRWWMVDGGCSARRRLFFWSCVLESCVFPLAVNSGFPFFCEWSID
ncbi:MAG: hypothetical protein MUF31_13455, partial [Akkermansiaceae bacterium]|nr:hypothetical protein [Akkermansiaceae bacterium]